MEAELEQPIVEVERLLIFENYEEITRMTAEAKQRCNLLNNILNAGLSREEITKVASSLESINTFLFQKQIDSNQELKKLIDAGIQGISAALSQEQASLKYSLLAWFNYPTYRGADKYQHLQFNNGRFELDNSALEKEFVLRRLKFYATGEQLNEFREIEFLCRFFERTRMPNNQIRESSFLWDRIEPIGMHKFKPRASWFMRDRN